jgi:hypothetical protein
VRIAVAVILAPMTYKEFTVGHPDG